MSYKKKAKSNSYLCTILWKNQDDIACLEKLKQGVAKKRKLLKARGERKLPVVTVKYRKPVLVYREGSNSKYGYGGTVCKRQLPQEADIYIHQRYL